MPEAAGRGEGELDHTERVESRTRPLPGGLVTFVMTDIEGSTRLFRTLGDTYVELLATHFSLLREAFGDHGGVEVGTEGDAILAAFPDAAEAVAACLDAQRALVQYDWPRGGELRVRMGVHTGEAQPVDGNYVAIAVHQVARISSGAHGSQVLVSAETVNELAGRLPTAATLRGLGSFQLRGFSTPARLFQLEHPDLDADFPPLRAIGVVTHNLPFLRTSFIGRNEDRSGLARALLSAGVVTVVGPGGVGKTRLAVQVGLDVMDGFADGARIADLEAVRDQASLARAVASAVGVAEEPGRETIEVLVEALSPKAMLLILDNCEHLVDAVAALVERLSRHCPRLVVLSTSREPLDAEGEVIWRLGPLSTASAHAEMSAEEASGSDAVRLFADRASLVRPDFDVTDDNAAEVAEVVLHLSGIPLAIELAAAALEDRSLTNVLQGLSDRFSLLTRGRRTAPGRHQTLRAAIEWSLDLLSPGERRLFDRLAIFSGMFSTDAAAAICAADGPAHHDIASMLRRLARASLLISDHDWPDRWSMSESIRELAALELEQHGETEALAARHRAWFMHRVEGVEHDLGRRGRADLMREQTADHDNVRRAIESAVEAGDAEVALRICAAMAPFWTSHGDWSEASEHLAAALALGGGGDGHRARAQVALGSIRLLRGEFNEASDLFAPVIADPPQAVDDATAARAHAGAGYVAFRHSDLAAARSHWEEALSLAERSGDERLISSVLRSLAIAAGSRGEQAEAGRLLDRAIASAERAEDDQQLRLLLGSSAEMNIWLGRYATAADTYGRALDLAADIGDISARPLLLAELGWVALLRGDVETALRLATEASELAEDLGNPRVRAHALRLRGEALARRGDATHAEEMFQSALEVAEQLGAPAEVAGVRCSQACLAIDCLRLDDARQLAEEAIARPAIGHSMRHRPLEWVLGTVALLEGDLENAEDHFRTNLRTATEVEVPRHAAAGLWGLGRVAAAAGRDQAAQLHHRAIEIRHEIDDRLGLAESLVALAETGAARDPVAAAQLLGAATTLRANAGATPTARDEQEVGNALAAIAAHLDPATLAENHDAGANMTDSAVLATAASLAAEKDNADR